MAHNAVNTRSQSLLHQKYTCTRPGRQMPFGVAALKIGSKIGGGESRTEINIVVSSGVNNSTAAKGYDCAFCDKS